MDDVGWARVRLDVLTDLGELGPVWCLKWVLLPALVHASEEPDLHVGDDLHDEWEESIDKHSLDESVSSHFIPTRDVVRVGTVEDTGSKSECLREVSLDEEQDQGGVEELGRKTPLVILVSISEWVS